VKKDTNFIILVGSQNGVSTLYPQGLNVTLKTVEKSLLRSG